MKYAPGDPQALVDTVIALDLLMTLLLHELARDRATAERLSSALQATIAAAPADLIGACAKLSDWKDLLNRLPSPSTEH